MSFYRPPGVYAREEIGSISPTSIPAGGMIALVSEVPKSTPKREFLTLEGTTPVELEKTGAVSGSFDVRSSNGLIRYVEEEDYTISATDEVDYLATKSIARTVNSVQGETFTLDSGAFKYKLANGRGAHNIRVYSVDDVTSEETEYTHLEDYVYDSRQHELVAQQNGVLPRDGTTLMVDYNHGIEDGEDVRVEYRYADEDYFSQVVTDNYDDIERKFGTPWNEDGTENPMSLAASIIFTNGGPQTMVMCVPVNPFTRDEENGVVNLVDYQRAIDSIVDDEVGLVVETTGNLNIQSSVIQNTIAAATDFEQPRMAILGRDNRLDGADRDALREYGEGINHERIVLVSPVEYYTLNDVYGENVKIGGQYAAAALAGLLSSMRVQDTATRDPISGISVVGKQQKGLMNSDAGSGLCVLENKGGVVQVRHAITTARGNVNAQEINVVRAKDFIIKSLKETLDPTVIGRLLEPNLDMVAQATASKVLDNMLNNDVLIDYSVPEVQVDPTNPTRLLMNFTYIPNYGVNEILITFSISDFGVTNTTA